MKKKRIELVCSVAELASLFENKTSIEGLLEQTVRLIAEHMGAEVCSIYLLEAENRQLVLRANVGLDASSVGSVRLRIGEGITGTALKEMRAVTVPSLSNSPFNKSIPGIQEEMFEAFLAVPLIYRMKRIGVITLQHSKQGFFDSRDAKAMTAIAAQLSNFLENAKLLMELHGTVTKDEFSGDVQSLPEFIKGSGRSEGIAIGTVHLFTDRSGDVLSPDPGKHYLQGLDAFQSALSKTKEQITNLQEEVEKNISDVGGLIFSSHLLMLADEAFSGEMEKLIQKGEKCEEAVSNVVNTYISLLNVSENEIVAEKVQDLKDLGHRILENLLPQDEAEYDYTGHIIIATEVFPSELIRLSAQNAEGLILRDQGMTSHILILAQSLDIPIITVDSSTLFSVPSHTPIIIDAYQGTVFIKPRQEVQNHYRHYLASKTATEGNLDAVKSCTKLKSGEVIEIYANVSLLSDMNIAVKYKACGVGLYRSEFPFLIRNTFPSEEEQLSIYKRLLQAAEGRPVMMRTLDLGGDKVLAQNKETIEPNPFLGLRGIRFTLKNRDIFITQIKAMLQAGDCSETNTVHILLPFISSMDELLTVKKMIRDISRELTDEEIVHCRSPKIGIMIELPSTIHIIDDLVREVDFLSIGTNDLVQYMLGVDRSNHLVSEYYSPLHPSILRGIQKIVDAAAKRGVPVSVCGESAADPIMAQIYIGMGITRLSISPKSIPELQRKLNRLSMTEATTLAHKALTIPTVKDLQELIH